MRIGVNSGSIDALDQRGQMQRIQVDYAMMAL